MKLDLNDSQLLYICFAGIIFTFVLENIYPYHSLIPACNRRVKTKKNDPLLAPTLAKYPFSLVPGGVWYCI